MTSKVKKHFSEAHFDTISRFFQISIMMVKDFGRVGHKSHIQSLLEYLEQVSRPQVIQKFSISHHGLLVLCQVFEKDLTFFLKISLFHSSTKILNMAKPYGFAIWLCHMAVPYGSAIWQCHMALPYGIAIWLCHMARPYGQTKYWKKHEIMPK